MSFIDEPRDVQQALKFVGINWHTEKCLADYHYQAVEAAGVIQRMAGLWLIFDEATPDQLPDYAVAHLLHGFLSATVSMMRFPDPPVEGEWEDLAAEADAWVEHTRTSLAGAIQTLHETDIWTRRRCVEAAWNIELAKETRETFTIGATVKDSAHRVVRASVVNLWLEYSLHVDRVQANASGDPKIHEDSWEQFIAAWPLQKLQIEAGKAGAALAGEYEHVRERLGFEAVKPTAVAVANWDEGGKALAAAIKQEPAADDAEAVKRERVAPAFVPTSADLDIEQAIREAPSTVSQADIEAASGHPLKLIKQRLPVLEKEGRVHRPHGKRKGYALFDGSDGSTDGTISTP